jgi:hypothetical protein
MEIIFHQAFAFTQTLCGAWRDSDANKADMFKGAGGGKIGTGTDCTGVCPPMMYVHACSNPDVNLSA